MPKTIALNDIFNHHPPLVQQDRHYRAIREGAKAFAAVIQDHTPESADQTAAIRHVLDAMMTANHAIAMNGHD